MLSRSRWMWRLSLLVLAFLVGSRAFDRFGDRSLRITFFDVGQGDAALVQFPGSQAWMIDGGGGFGESDVGSRELFPELARLGILRLDVALLSHPDQDHGYGFRGLLQNLEVGSLWAKAGVAEEHRPLLEALVAEATARGTGVRRLAAAERWRVSGVVADVVPLESDDARSNDHALVLRLEYGGCRVLFTGDIERRAERVLLEKLPEKITLLKVAHHGSNTSSSEAFLDVTRPRWAVISSGEGNAYGHPHSAAVTRLERSGAKVFRTDFHGYVRFVIREDGTVQCRTAQGSCGESRCEEATEAEKRRSKGRDSGTTSTGK